MITVYCVGAMFKRSLSFTISLLGISLSANAQRVLRDLASTRSVFTNFTRVEIPSLAINSTTNGSVANFDGRRIHGFG
jgi:hypothetical protein